MRKRRASWRHARSSGGDEVDGTLDGTMTNGRGSTEPARRLGSEPQQLRLLGVSLLTSGAEGPVLVPGLGLVFDAAGLTISKASGEVVKTMPWESMSAIGTEHQLDRPQDEVLLRVSSVGRSHRFVISGVDRGSFGELLSRLASRYRGGGAPVPSSGEAAAPRRGAKGPPSVESLLVAPPEQRAPESAAGPAATAARDEDSRAGEQRPAAPAAEPAQAREVLPQTSKPRAPEAPGPAAEPPAPAVRAAEVPAPAAPSPEAPAPEPLAAGTPKPAPEGRASTPWAVPKSEPASPGPVSQPVPASQPPAASEPAAGPPSAGGGKAAKAPEPGEATTQMGTTKPEVIQVWGGTTKDARADLPAQARRTSTPRKALLGLLGVLLIAALAFLGLYFAQRQGAIDILPHSIVTPPAGAAVPSAQLDRPGSASGAATGSGLQLPRTAATSTGSSSSGNGSHAGVPVIPGLTVGQLTGISENEGFSCSPVGTTSFNCNRPAQDAMVHISSPDGQSVSSVSVTVLGPPGSASFDPMLQPFAAVTYPGSSPSQASQWLGSSLSGGGKTSIGSVSYTLVAVPDRTLLELSAGGAASQ